MVKAGSLHQQQNWTLPGWLKTSKIRSRPIYIIVYDFMQWSLFGASLCGVWLSYSWVVETADMEFWGEGATRGGWVGVQISMHPGHLDEQHMWRFFSWMNFIVLVFLIVLSLGPDPWVLLLNHSHTWWCYGTFLTWLWRWIKENVILRLFRHCLCIFSSQWFLGT